MKRDKPEDSKSTEIAKNPYSGLSQKDENSELKATLEKVTNFDLILGDVMCGICLKDISKSIKILCAECEIKICLECFANGKEKSPHVKNHDYYVLDRLETPIFDPGWTVYEEIKLLKGIEKFGNDNWAEIADFLSTKSADECEKHYCAFYYRSKNERVPLPNTQIALRHEKGFTIDNVQAEKNKTLLEKAAERLKEKGSERNAEAGQPPSPQKGGKTPSKPTENESDVVGYMPLRGDFNVEYDNDAELMLMDMEFADDDKKEDLDLKYEVLRVYNAKLDERIRRKKFVIDHGLTDHKSILAQQAKLSRDELEVYSLLRPFQRFCTDDEYKKLADGLLQEIYLRQRIDELKKYKAMGLDTVEKIEQYLSKKGGKLESCESSKAPNKPDESLNLENQENKIKGTSKSIEISKSNAENSVKSEESKEISEHSENEENVSEQILEIRRADGYKEMSEEEKKFCEKNMLFPRVYQQYKVKLQQKAAKSRKGMRRATAAEVADRPGDKQKVMSIFDFLSSNKMLEQTE